MALIQAKQSSSAPTLSVMEKQRVVFKGFLSVGDMGVAVFFFWWREVIDAV